MAQWYKAIPLEEPNFTALTEASQTKILQREVNFQGQLVQLKELLNIEAQKQFVKVY